MAAQRTLRYGYKCSVRFVFAQPIDFAGAALQRIEVGGLLLNRAGACRDRDDDAPPNVIPSGLRVADQCGEADFELEAACQAGGTGQVGILGTHGAQRRWRKR